MKRTMIILAILMTTVSLAAQETGTYRDNAPKFYATTDFSVSGGDFQGWGKSDFGIVGLGVYPGDLPATGRYSFRYHVISYF